ncbi:hypothetical protein [Limosilactobacillus oris]|uniref:hypothetical protein n=1 Tax=Limosilactobacillus oris TaxID=1632 RepID=UPI0032089A23
MSEVEKMIEAQAIAESNKERQELIKRFKDSWLEPVDIKPVVVEILKDQLQKESEVDFGDKGSQELQLKFCKAIEALED